MKNEMDLYLQYNGTVKVSRMTPSDLKNLIQRGESSFLEFKHSVASPEKLAKEISAFANSRGGTILVGVMDNGDMVGVEGYFEQEFLLNQAANDECIPAVPVEIEMMNIGERDILIVKVPEAEEKPVYVKGEKVRQVYIRQDDESVVASDERIDLLKTNSSEEGVTFEYGEREQKLFRYLNEYGSITVDRFALLISVTTYRAAKILVNMVSAGILDLFDKEGVAHYTFSQKSS